jgi:hypothetical protein
MTTATLRALLTTTIAVVAAPFVAAGCNIEPSAPDTPTYETDVQPILMARCVRCHGSPPLGEPTSGPAPGTERYDVFADSPECASGANGCVRGASAFAQLFPAYVHVDSRTRMPPRPAPALTSYQIDVFDRWAAEPTPLER